MYRSTAERPTEIAHTQEETLSAHAVTEDAADTTGTSSPDPSSTPARRPWPAWYRVLTGLLVVVIAVTAVPALTEHPHQPGVSDFFPQTFLGEGTFLEVNRLVLVRLVMAAVLCLLVVAAASGTRRVPGHGRALLEVVADFLRSNVALPMLGPGRGRRFAPFLTALFLGVLAMNLAGIVPGLNIAASAVIAVPLVFALTTYATFIGAGVRAQGLGRFLSSQLFPPGLPRPMYLLITPIEFLSTFIVRPATLTLRLLCNMVAGHLLLAMTYFGTTTLLLHLQATSVLSVLTGVSMVAMTLFEVFVAVLQAYIFTILSAVYIRLSVEAH